MERSGRSGRSAAPEAYQPQLTAWSHTWRIGLALAFSAVSWLPNLPDQTAAARLVDVGVGLACYVGVLHRRRRPVATGVLVGLLSCVSGVAAGPSALVTVSVASRRRWVEIAPVAVATFVGGQVYSMTQPAGDGNSVWLILSVNTVITAGLFAWGMYIGSRRELVWTLRRRAEEAESEQELRAARARETERARIAREMHDVLAHRISQIAMHAGALAFREDLSAAQMRDHAGVIQAKAHEALTDLRGVLGVLRDAEGAPLDAPQPTYADLPDLVAEARRTGLTIDFRDTVPDASEVPAGTGRTVYRIVQEGITNAHKHAPGTRLTIALSGSPESGVDVVLRNPLGFAQHLPPGAAGPTPGAGLGLVGLSERTELRGGRLEHRTDGAAFVLHGWLPWAA